MNIQHTQLIIWLTFIISLTILAISAKRARAATPAPDKYYIPVEKLPEFMRYLQNDTWCHIPSMTSEEFAEAWAAFIHLQKTTAQ